MTWWKALALAATAAGLAGCVTPTHVENAALTMPWPKSPSGELLAYAPPDDDYPSVGGDILKGASPADRAAARAAAEHPVATPAPP
jgi:hypothetical protein